MQCGTSIWQLFIFTLARYFHLNASEYITYLHKWQKILNFRKHFLFLLENHRHNYTIIHILEVLTVKQAADEGWVKYIQNSGAGLLHVFICPGTFQMVTMLVNVNRNRSRVPNVLTGLLVHDKLSYIFT